jgi:hypothetical protein
MIALEFFGRATGQRRLSAPAAGAKALVGTNPAVLNRLSVAGPQTLVWR